MKQFNHNRKYLTNDFDATVCIEVPNKTFLETMFVQHANESIFMLGATITSPNDHFVKKIGREIAESRLSPTLVHLESVHQNITKHNYVFSAKVTIKNKKYNLDFVVSTVAESNDSYLISSYLYE